MRSMMTQESVDGVKDHREIPERYECLVKLYLFLSTPYFMCI